VKRCVTAYAEQDRKETQLKSFGATGRNLGFDATAVTETIARALAAAGLDTGSGPMKQVTDTIEAALSAAGLMPGNDPEGTGITIDGSARRVESPAELIVEGAGVPQSEVFEPETTRTLRPQPGEFLARSYTAAAGTRAYKAYIPKGYSSGPGEPVPMVVMLHGCTQSPDDFARGTRMNALADEHGFIVVYPAQCATANAQKCWNWFRTEDQLRESGEPAIIAGITNEVAGTYNVDRRRIFVAGMSAGGAMAVILATTYPDLYAGVGVHSGLAYGAAHDVPSAFRAMHAPGSSTGPARGGSIPVPAIVFQGDNDRTVSAGNAETIVRHAIAGHARMNLREDASSGSAAGGRKFSRKVYADARNGVAVEHWIVHGAGHAWSGGSAAGTFTDHKGPDASKEMIRFFLALTRAGCA
jgi:poly(hydroxyalkanoate) depolymerase family esterase